MKKDDPLDFDVFSSAWLRGVSSQAIGEIRKNGEYVRVSDKSIVYAIGGPQEWLWGIAAGCVQVRVALSEMEPVLGHIHQAGAWFGESEPFHEGGGLVEMKSVGSILLFRIPFSKFRTSANLRPELWEALVRLTSMNQLLAMSAANDLALRTSRKRLAATLLRLSGRRGVLQGSRIADVVQANQPDIANLANVSISKASEHLGAMSKEGLIGLEYGRIRLLDPDGLTSITVP